MLTHQARFCSRAAGVIPPLRHLLFLHTVIDISSLSIVKILAHYFHALTNIQC